MTREIQKKNDKNSITYWKPCVLCFCPVPKFLLGTTNAAPTQPAQRSPFPRTAQAELGQPAWQGQATGRFISSGHMDCFGEFRGWYQGDGIKAIVRCGQHLMVAVPWKRSDTRSKLAFTFCHFEPQRTVAELDARRGARLRTPVGEEPRVGPRGSRWSVAVQRAHSGIRNPRLTARRL